MKKPIGPPIFALGDNLTLVVRHPDLSRSRAIRIRLTAREARALAEKLLEQADLADDGFATLPAAVGIN